MCERLPRSGLHDRSQVDDPDGRWWFAPGPGIRRRLLSLSPACRPPYAVARGFGLSSDAVQEVTQEAFLRAWRR